MAVFNLRGVPEEFARQVKATAAIEGVTLVQFVIDRLERDRKNGGWTSATVKEPKRQKGKQDAAANSGVSIERMAEQCGGAAVLEIVEDAVSPKSQASSGRGSGGHGGKRIGISEWPEDKGQCSLCGGLNGLHQKGCKG
jgi:hypothetical protein